VTNAAKFVLSERRRRVLEDACAKKWGLNPDGIQLGNCGKLSNGKDRGNQ